ncbi:MAG: site-specific integrase [Tannerellaceae bacterium]|nr:site-specific integrase [Tannerellaceae bacterium]
MKKVTFKILFYLKRNQPDVKGNIPVMVRVTVSGSQSTFATQCNVPLKTWNETTKRVTGKNSKSINEYLDNIEFKIRGCFNNLNVNNRIPVTAERVKNAFFGVGEEDQSLMKLFQQHLKELNELEMCGEISEDTLKKHTRTFNRLSDYIKQEYKVSDITFYEVNHSFIEGFKIYIMSTYKASLNTANKHLEHLKKVTTRAKNNGWLILDPFYGYKLKYKPGEVKPLTELQLNKLLITKMPHPTLEVIKDLFLFSCYSGLAWVDIYNLNEDNIIIDDNGVSWIIGKRKKTVKEYRAILLPIPELIINKYKDYPVRLLKESVEVTKIEEKEKIVDGKKIVKKVKVKEMITVYKKALLPGFANQYMNRCLKQITAIVGFTDVQLTTHMARHTFATVSLTEGASLETVSKALGHSSIKSTKIYAEITDQKVKKELSIVAKNVSSHTAQYLENQ